MSDSLRPHGLQASLSMGFSRQEYWSGLPFPSPGDLPNPGIEPRSGTEPMSSTLQSFTTPNFEIYNTKVLKSHDIKEKLWSLLLKQTAIILLKSKAWKFKGHICIDSTIIPSSFFFFCLHYSHNIFQNITEHWRRLTSLVFSNIRGAFFFFWSLKHFPHNIEVSFFCKKLNYALKSASKECLFSCVCVYVAMQLLLLTRLFAKNCSTLK